MNIEELSQYGDDYVQPLVMLYKRVGNHSKDGYLGEKLDVLFDGDGKLHYSTHKEINEGAVDSQGVVLGDSVLIKQVQRSHDLTSYRLYFWDTKKDMYTFLSFDNELSLNRYYDVIQRFGVSLCDEDISILFQEMGLTFESVNQILINQRNNPLDYMFEEDEEKSTPFTM